MIEFIIHNQKEIMYVDFKEVNSQDELMDLFWEGINIVKSSEKCYLVLLDFTGTIVGRKFISEAIKQSKMVFEHRNLKSAVIGITGLKSILLDTYLAATNSKLKSFDSKPAALNYLVS